jgi:hypothetical protein
LGVGDGFIKSLASTSIVKERPASAEVGLKVKIPVAESKVTKLGRAELDC